jgi:hypothetical protein
MKAYAGRTAVALACGLAAWTGCSSDLFNPPKAPEITGLTLSRYEVDPGDTVVAAVSIRDAKDQILHYDWTASGGRFLPPLDVSQIQWKSAAEGGVYLLTVKVSNEDKSSSRSQDITVRSFALPDVTILAPEDNAYFVQYSTLAVSARARHDNGIARVDLFLGANLMATLNGRTNGMYSFTCPLDVPSGPIWVRIEAVANVTGRAGSDSARIHVEGIVPGKASRSGAERGNSIAAGRGPVSSLR